MYRFLVPGWSAKPLVSAHDRIMGTHSLDRGKTKREAIRALKRRISDRVWTHLQADLQHTKPDPA